VRVYAMHVPPAPALWSSARPGAGGTSHWPRPKNQPNGGFVGDGKIPPEPNRAAGFEPLQQQLLASGNMDPGFGALGCDPDTVIIALSGNGVIAFSGAI
jgi:hypothetical protein